MNECLKAVSGRPVRWHGIVILMLLGATLSGCAKPVPLDKSDYVGEWTSPEMYLLITQDGSVRYQRLRRGMETSLTGPLQEFIGNDFRVGFWFFSTTFVVSTPPHQTDDGTWRMVVDGVELIRAD
ncbi:MAG TPA: hypothetical protein VNN17_06160 [Terriglobia bacterium]|nr:hypothetical protein [Terriglobia bacterium]